MQRGVTCASVYMGNGWFGVCYTSDDDCCASTVYSGCLWIRASTCFYMGELRIWCVVTPVMRTQRMLCATRVLKVRIGGCLKLMK